MNVPSFSAVPAAGQQKHFGGDCLPAYSSPRSTSGESYQNEAVSISTMSRTTSHFSLDSAVRCKPSVRRTNGGVLAHDEQAFHLAVGHVEPVTEVGVVARDARQPIEIPSRFLWSRASPY